MEIVSANTSHVEYISESLSQYFSRVNQDFRYPRYKEDVDLMRKHVSKRIENVDSNFVYFVAQEGDDPVGFINLLIDENGVGSILVVISEDKDVKIELVKRAVAYFKDKGLLSFYGEAMYFDKDLIDILNTLGKEDIMVHYTVNI